MTARAVDPVMATFATASRRALERHEQGLPLVPEDATRRPSDLEIAAAVRQAVAEVLAEFEAAHPERFATAEAPA